MMNSLYIIVAIKLVVIYTSGLDEWLFLCVFYTRGVFSSIINIKCSSLKIVIKKKIIVNYRIKQDIRMFVNLYHNFFPPKGFWLLTYHV